MSSRWTTDELGRLRDMRQAGKSTEHIARVLHRSASSVYTKALALGLTRPMTRARVAPSAPKPKSSETTAGSRLLAAFLRKPSGTPLVEQPARRRADPPVSGKPSSCP